MRRVMFKFLDYLFEGMYEVESKKNPNERFWKKNGEVVLKLSPIYQRDLLVSNSIWDEISDMLSLNYNQIQQFIKDWVEQHLELSGITPYRIEYIEQ